MRQCVAVAQTPPPSHVTLPSPARRRTLPAYQHAAGITEISHNDTIRYDTRCYFNVRSKADISQLNLPHGTDN